MSAAEPADPTRPYVVNTTRGAAVLDMTKRLRHAGAPTAARGRWNTMTTPAPEPPHGRNRSDLEGVADFVEKWFNDIEVTLTDPAAAAVFVRTVDFVDHILHGAVAQQIITEEERVKLSDLLDAARQAPGLV